MASRESGNQVVGDFRWPLATAAATVPRSIVPCSSPSSTTSPASCTAAHLSPLAAARRSPLCSLLQCRR
ncbi:hypothetical protein SOVF_146450 [Spinacia oleracea]|nr:hypothetical protein SOVF_146450 [Spinacia oleracea]